MNSCFSDWNIEAELPLTSQKKPLGADHELVELLWRNGQVVLHSQTQRKPANDPNESKQVHKHDQTALRASGSCGNPVDLIHDDEPVSWIHYPLDDSFEKFCSNFFFETPSSNPIEADKSIRQVEEKFVKFNKSDANNVLPSSQQSGFVANPMPPPKFQPSDSDQPHPNLEGVRKNAGFSQYPATVRADLGSSNGHFGGNGSSDMTQAEVRECSVMTVGSSHCGSNQVANDADMSRASSIGVGARGLSVAPVREADRKIIPQCDSGETETLEPAITSSSGGSGSSFGRTCNQSIDTNSHKRKGRDAEESECQSEAAELDSAAGSKQAKRSGTARRSRAAEVHNLSERRRRDRINEKMKALQELIPHSNKSDKASMLDEAIEYLKSLQLQLQMMWMGSGMAPMMFPGVQHYMSRMGMGMGPPPLPSIHNPMNLQRVPMVDQAISMAPTPNQSAICGTQVLNHVNYQNQMQTPNLSEQYARYMGFQPMQSASQPANIFSFGSPMVQQSHMTAPPGSSSGPSIGRAATDDALGGRANQ